MQGTERDLNYKVTELCLGLPGGGGGGAAAAGGENEVESSPKTTGKRGFSGMDLDQNLGNGSKETSYTKDPANHQPRHSIGWPPVRSYRKSIMANQKNNSEECQKAAALVKVSMDGAPFCVRWI
ncbi:auxin-responsive protein IAA14-like [Hibiscus syriacus]|uniref:auxin-responsive protein IAA14-like n=1 Tax=Hibiscus syriacus TaxID=106335 RepID=UPI001923B311|nr:auxin-responsive protein IAA14-like [Hibiscus syriacus]